jgi:hypothetical protein
VKPRGRSVAETERRLHLIDVGLDDDELALVLEMMRLTNAGTPTSVIKTALYKHAKFLGLSVAPDAFALWRTRDEHARRSRTRRNRGAK